MYKEKRFSEEQLKEADDINIIALARSHGYDVKRITPRSYKIPSYGGLYIKADGSKWNWFSHGKGGGAIQFLMELENKSWVDAVKELLGINNEELPYVEPPSKNIDKKGKLVLPNKNKTYKHIFAYLIQTRNIDSNVVKEFVKNKQLYEDEKNNCVFVGHNESDEPRFASLRGTSLKRFRKDLYGSDKTYPFHREGTNEVLMIFESAIDLMSYMTLVKLYDLKDFKHHMISMGGTSYLPIEYYTNKYPNIKKMILCLDNDEEGHFFSQQIHDRYRDKFQITKHVPVHKDFNEDLINIHNKPIKLDNKETDKCADEEIVI